MGNEVHCLKCDIYTIRGMFVFLFPKLGGYQPFDWVNGGKLFVGPDSPKKGLGMVPGGFSMLARLLNFRMVNNGIVDVSLINR